MAERSACFLGANTPKGFVSFFDELYNPYSNAEAYIIKGGPGTGKSGFMKRVALEAHKRNLSYERVYCSSDPSSLDGLIIPEKNLCFCDGTSPHIVEPRFPGVAENIINLGEFWDAGKLRKNADEIKRLFFENSLCHRKSVSYLAAAGHIDLQSRVLTEKYIIKEKVEGFATRFIYRELRSKRKSSPGQRKRRFLSAVTSVGNLFLSDTVKSLCTRVIGIDDRQSAVSSMLVSLIGEGAIKNGYDAIFCHCPLKPEVAEHLIIPEKKIAIIRINGAAGEVSCDRIIHTGRFMNEDFGKNKLILRFNERVKQELINESIKSLRDAKKIHDSLEEIYTDAMDFERLNTYCDSFIEKLFT